MRNMWWVVALLVAVLVVIVLAPLASSDPDGLERVAQEAGFTDAGQDATYRILPDYSVPGVTDGGISTIVAGLIGVAIVFLLMWGLGALLARRRRAADNEPS